jgi:trimeric autotransporter adhesin
MRFLRIITGQHLPARLNSFCCVLAIACLSWCGTPQQVWASQATATTLSLTSGGNAASSVAAGTVVTLTATVQAGGTALNLGQVNFCDATAASCTDIHLLGTAQLTSAGTAVFKFRPGPGSHSYKAVFLGSLAGAASGSTTVALTVGPRPPGAQASYTVASATGPVATAAYNTYALTASVGTKGANPPSGTVSFSGILNTTNPYSLPGTATLRPVTGGTGFLNIPVAVRGGGADGATIFVISDFNGDGIPDIVSSPDAGIVVSLGNGDGTFAAPLISNIDSNNGIDAFGVGDFNGDGITDLAVINEDGGDLMVLLGKGDGTFTAGQSLPFAANSMAIADFNGDGKLDIAVPGNPTTILLGNGDGTFTAAPNPPQVSSVQVVAADFNGDGKIDLAVVGYDRTTFTITPVTILLGNGDGTFTAPSSQPQLVASQLVAADFNGDGKVDLAAFDAMRDSVTILLGNGDGTFTASSTLSLDSNFVGQSLAVGDFNGDGKPDVAVAASPNNSDMGGELTIFVGKGDGTFAAGFDVSPTVDPMLLTEELTSLATADFTGNGSSDLAIFGSVFLGNLTIATATANNVLPGGFNVIQADYAGDANDAPSSSTTTPIIDVPQPPLSLTSNPVTVTTPGASASGSFSVTSSGFTGALNLSCSISTPQSGANSLACSVPPTVNLSFASGTVNETYTVSTQATTKAGQYSITITATDPVTGTTVSTSAAISVNTQNYLLTNSGATIASPGASGSSTITVSPTGGYAGQITMSCAVSGGPSGAVNSPTCTIPSPVSVTGSPVTTTLTLNTQPTTTPGSYTVTVTAASAGSLNAITSFAVNVPAAPPGFTLSSTAVTIAAPGPNATSTITISPNGGFAGNVSLACAVAGGPMGGVDAPTYSVTAPPAIVGTTAVTATLTVSTTAAPTATNGHSLAHSQHSPRGVAIGGSAMAIASLLLFGLPLRRRRTMTWLGLLSIATLIGATIGCSGTTAPAPAANPGTTPGAYTVTVAGSSGSIMATTAVTVTVN